MVKISYTDVISTEVVMGTIVRVLQWVILITLPLFIPRWTGAQTPQQMEYERQQREYRLQQEQQRQEQQRQQQLMDENARRQQEESRRLNAPMGQSPTPSYQGGAPQVAPRRPGTQSDATAAIAGADWAPAGGYQEAGLALYAARSTIRRVDDLVKMWSMYDFKNGKVIDGKQYLSFKNQLEFDCKNARSRILSARYSDAWLRSRHYEQQFPA